MDYLSFYVPVKWGIRQSFNGDDILRNILFEEIQPFFEGHKSAEEAAKIIQSRVSLYLAE